MHHDFLRDPIATIRGIYDHFAIGFTAAAEERMRDSLADNPKDKHGRGRYSLADSGLDAERENALRRLSRTLRNK